MAPTVPSTIRNEAPIVKAPPSTSTSKLRLKRTIPFIRNQFASCYADVMIFIIYQIFQVPIFHQYITKCVSKQSVPGNFLILQKVVGLLASKKFKDAWKIMMNFIWMQPRDQHQHLLLPITFLWKVIAMKTVYFYDPLLVFVTVRRTQVIRKLD